MKTKKIVTKRYKLTKTGKLTHRAQGRRHLRRKKSSAHKRRQDKTTSLKSSKQARTIRRMFGA